MAWIGLSRTMDVGAIARRMTFHVDGKPVARLRRGESAHCEATPGIHVVQARMDWLRSSPLELKLDDDMSLTVTGALTEYSMTFAGMFLKPGSALNLRVASGAAD